MFIDEYGFIVFYDGKRFAALEDGLPEPEFGKRVEVKHNGLPFISYTENAAHIPCSIYYGIEIPANQAQLNIATAFSNHRNIMIEKNKQYKTAGRESTILSKVLYTLAEIEKKSMFDANTLERIDALKTLLEKNFVNLYAEQREEKDVC